MANKNNKRDYDKEPLVIADKNDKCQILSIIIQVLCATIVCVFADIAIDRKVFIIFISTITVKRQMSEIKSNCYVYFYNERIKLISNQSVQTIQINDINKVLKTLSAVLPKNYFDVWGSVSFVYFFLAIMILQVLLSPEQSFIIVFSMVLIVVVLLLPQFIVHLNDDYDWFYDVIFIKGLKDNAINFMLTSQDDYNELKKYFLSKGIKNLDKAEKKIWAGSEFKKSDFSEKGEFYE